MSYGFVFYHPQPAIVVDERGRRVCVVYPAGPAYAVVTIEDGQVSLRLPASGGETDVLLSFSARAGRLVPTPAAEPPALISFREAYARFPALVSNAKLDDYGSS